jgi:hypothetical protein
MRLILLTAALCAAIAACAAIATFSRFYSFCPSRSFAIGSVIGVAGSAACHEADIKRERDDNPTEKVLNGGI